MTDTNGVVDEAGFRRAIAATARPVDVAAIVAVPLVLVAVFVLPPTIRERLVFESANPTVRTAYVSHFVHRQQLHLLGNVSVYLVVAPMTYLLCILCGRRQLFRVSFVTVFTTFPFALSMLQLVFPRHREILGFSGINASFFGFLCVVWVLYTGRHFLGDASALYAPALLFVMTGVIALIVLPQRAWRLEIAVASIGVGLGYALAWLLSHGGPDRATLAAGFERFGYAELAGAGFGLLASFPLVGFRGVVSVETGVLDVYIHLLGYSLAFIVVYSYTMLVERLPYSSQ